MSVYDPYMEHHEPSQAVTVIIPNWNGHRWLPGCLDALKQQTRKADRIIVVDNGSTDESVHWLRQQHQDVEIIEMGRNTGFAAAVNAGIGASDTPFLALLNNDTVVRADWLETLIDALTSQPPDVGAVCGKMLRMDQPDRIENAGDTLSWQGAAEKRGRDEPATAFDAPDAVFSVCAGGALYRRAFFDRVGLFDESFFAYLEDIDIGLRGHVYGFRYRYEPRAVLLHHSHGSAIPSAFYVRLTTANRLRVFFKNMPAALLWRHAGSLLYGQWYFAVCNRRPLSTLLGYWDLIRSAAQWRVARHNYLRELAITPDALDALLLPRMQQPGLIRAMMRRLRKQETTR